MAVPEVCNAGGVETVIRAILTGEQDELGEIPAGDLAKLILGLQSALAAAASTVVRQRRRSGTGRHPAAIEAASRLRFQGVEPGSVRAVFALPEVQLDDGAGRDDAPDLSQLAFGRLVDALRADEADLDPELARAIARLGNDLNIGVGGRRLELTSSGHRSGVLDAETRSRMNRTARRRPPRRDDVIVGNLVEADFERNTARVQPVAGPPVQITFPDEMADLVQANLRHVGEWHGEVSLDPATSAVNRMAVEELRVAEPLALGIEADSFWHHSTVEQLAREQGVVVPQRTEDLRTRLTFTDEEIDDFFSGADE